MQPRKSGQSCRSKFDWRFSVAQQKASPKWALSNYCWTFDRLQANFTFLAFCCKIIFKARSCESPRGAEWSFLRSHRLNKCSNVELLRYYSIRWLFVCLSMLVQIEKNPHKDTNFQRIIRICANTISSMREKCININSKLSPLYEPFKLEAKQTKKNFFRLLSSARFFWVNFIILPVNRILHNYYLVDWRFPSNMPFQKWCEAP